MDNIRASVCYSQLFGETGNLNTCPSISKEVEKSAYLLPVGALLSLICYSYLLWMYFLKKSLVFRRHPTELAIYKCIFDVFFVQQYLWLSTVQNKVFYNGYTEDNEGNQGIQNCCGSPTAGGLAFLTQFSLLGSELCFFIISLDLRNAYTNPFSSYQQKKKFYAAFVVIVAMISAIALISMGPAVYGVASEGVIWIQTRKTISIDDDGEEDIPTNYPKFILYYFIVACIYLYCLWTTFQFYRRSERGFSYTLSNRIPIMQRSRRYTLSYILFDTITLGLEFLSFIVSNQYKGSHQGVVDAVNSLPAYFYCSRGIFALLIILYSNKRDLSWKNLNPFSSSSLSEGDEQKSLALEKLLQQPHLNTALRIEVLYFTTKGIMHAASDLENELSQVENISPRNLNIDANISIDEHRFYSFNGKDAEASLFSNKDSDIYSRESTDRFSRTPFHPEYEVYKVNENRQSDLEKLKCGQLAAVRSEIDLALEDEIHSKARSSRTSGVGMSSQRSSLRYSLRNSQLDSINNSQQRNSYSLNRSFKGEEDGDLNSLLADGNRVDQLNDGTVSSNVSRATPESSELTILGESHRKSDSAFKRSNSLYRNDSSKISEGNVSVTNNLWVRIPKPLTNSSPRLKAGASSDVEFHIRSSQVSMPSNIINSDSQTDELNWRRVENAPFPSDRGLGNKNSEELHRKNRSNSNSFQSPTALLNVVGSLVSAVFTRPMYRDFKFKDFRPRLFARVREMHNIGADAYAKAFVTTCRERFTEGRSGAFMFYSSDQKCIVKSCPRSEILTLLDILSSYVEYLERNPYSLIARYIGAHSITMYGKEIFFLVMLNILPSDNTITERYDLKGSWINRHAKLSQGLRRSLLTRKDHENESPLYMDNDLQQKISLNPLIIRDFAKQAHKDVTFLKDLRRMDYSLLIGVRRQQFYVHKDTHKTVGSESDLAVLRNSEDVCNSKTAWRVMSADVPEDLFRRDVTGAHVASMVEGAGAYFIGIVDILQSWNFKKRAERFFKVYLKGMDPRGISAVEPDEFAERFFQRCVIEVFDGMDDNEDLYIGTPPVRSHLDDIESSSGNSIQGDSSSGRKTEQKIDN